jgi:nucleoside 2-deoxyribosyltransferase
MTYLKDKNVYLAGPMYACQDDGVGWRDQITPELIEKYGLVVEDPCKKTANGLGEVADDKKNFQQLLKDDIAVARETFWPIVRKDLRCVDKADFIIVTYDATIHSVGTIHELVVCDFQKKPVLMKYDKSQIDSGQFNIWASILTRPEWMFAEWIDMFNYLDRVDQGDINRKFWTI